MKTNTIKTLFTILTVLAAFLLPGAAGSSHAQVISPTGTTTNVGSQLIVWQSSDFGPLDSFQVTNTSNTSSVTVHIQFWSTDGSGDPVTAPCLEDNFTDTFTPNDTHVYDMSVLLRNSDGSDTGVSPIDGSLGKFESFITITSVISSTDRRAIAFNHLLGTMMLSGPDLDNASESAMGRRALSFITGDPLTDGTILDGVTTGLELLQPDLLKFVFIGDLPDGPSTRINIVTIMFSDNYSGPFGDYRSQPSSATFSPLIFNEAEVPTSCQTRTFTCLRDQGINDVIPNHNTFYTSTGDPEALICPGNNLLTGWMRLTVTGIESTGNVIGLTRFVNIDLLTTAAKWMVAEGESVIPTPPTPTPTAEPTATPTPDGGTPTGGGSPGGGGGSSGCAIAGPAQAGTAAANALIVLLPAIGFALRRKFKKS